MKADALNPDSYPVRMEMNGVRQILISHVCSMDGRKSNEFLVDEALLQVCSIEKDESKSIIADKSYTEEIKSEYFHKILNK